MRHLSAIPQLQFKTLNSKNPQRKKQICHNRSNVGFNRNTSNLRRIRNGKKRTQRSSESRLNNPKKKSEKPQHGKRKRRKLPRKRNEEIEGTDRRGTRRRLSESEEGSSANEDREAQRENYGFERKKICVSLERLSFDKLIYREKLCMWRFFSSLLYLRVFLCEFSCWLERTKRNFVLLLLFF